MQHAAAMEPPTGSPSQFATIASSHDNDDVTIQLPLSGWLVDRCPPLAEAVASNVAWTCQMPTSEELVLWLQYVLNGGEDAGFGPIPGKQGGSTETPKGIGDDESAKEGSRGAGWAEWRPQEEGQSPKAPGRLQDLQELRSWRVAEEDPREVREAHKPHDPTEVFQVILKVATLMGDKETCVALAHMGGIHGGAGGASSGAAAAAAATGSNGGAADGHGGAE
jgi:hypothetical protein